MIQFPPESPYVVLLYTLQAGSASVAPEFTNIVLPAPFPAREKQKRRPGKAPPPAGPRQVQKTAARRKPGGGAVYTVCKGDQALAWEAATAQATVMPTIGL